MANSNTMARVDADKSHVGAKMLVLDSAGDVGQVAFGGRVMAWVNFDGTASSITPRGSANVSSITDVGTGDYKINFTTPMPDTNYIGIGNVRRTASPYQILMSPLDDGVKTTSIHEIVTFNSSTAAQVDCHYVHYAAMR